MTKATSELQVKKERLEQIANLFTQGQATIDDILPLTEEAMSIKKEIMERIVQIETALNEKIESEAKDL
jgi:hypothetical protein